MDKHRLAHEAASLLARLRETRPLVQMITNFVSMDVAANVLLAIGAAPAMVHAPEETPEFVQKAAALVINTGTLSRTWADSMEVATASARMHATPWILDPVGAGATSFRDDTVQKLLRRRPTVIRGNASEIISVARAAGLTRDAARPSGVESTSTVDEADHLARTLARHCFCTVAATGPIDLVTDGQRAVRLANGSPLMTRVTALGCALSGVIGAFVALGEDPFVATASAIGLYGVAGTMAAEEAAGPASFRTAFIDILARIEAEDLVARLTLV